MFRTVSTYTTAIEAHVVRGRLECEGIPAFVTFEQHIWAQWSLSVALGGVRVQVPRSHYEEAARVLDSIKSGGYVSDLEREIPPEAFPCCPKCQSKDCVPVSWSAKLALLSVFLFAIPIPYTQHLMRCGTCSRVWSASEQRGYPLYVSFFTVVMIWMLIAVGYALWCHWCRIHCVQLICP